MLCEQNVNINAQDKNNKTALHLAADRTNKDVITFLLEKNADASINDKFDKTPGAYYSEITLVSNK